MAFIYMIPVFTTFINSFAPPTELAASVVNKSKVLFPESFSLLQYYDLLVEKARYLGMFWNSFLYSSTITLAGMLAGIPTAFILAKFNFKSRNVILSILVIIILMPFQVTLLPNYIISRFLGLLNTRWSVILPGIFAPFGIFLLIQFFRYMPDEMIEAVLIESKSVWDIFKIAVLPFAKPGIIAVTIINFAENWNMVEQPLVLINDILKRPLSAVFNSVLREGADIAYAGSFFYMLPIILLFIFLEEYVIDGLTEWTKIMRR
ncbi:MAG: carbohydrate ABC transporter permease [Eubacteriales bacterium]|nr:carbohydrate ABC transporter permease [Eubacteriales bacterium]